MAQEGTVFIIYEDMEVVVESGPAWANGKGIERRSGQMIRAIAMQWKDCSHGQLEGFLWILNKEMINKGYGWEKVGDLRTKASYVSPFFARLDEMVRLGCALFHARGPARLLT